LELDECDEARVRIVDEDALGLIAAAQLAHDIKRAGFSLTMNRATYTIFIDLPPTI